MSASPTAPNPAAPSGASAFEPIAAGEHACAVNLGVFEGPLDLLLHLIRSNELDITELALARVAEQYLAYVELIQELELDVATEYLLMAATLAWIKSRMLLPVEGEEDAEEGGDPRAELLARLLEYQRFKEAAEELAARPMLGRDVFDVRGTLPEPAPEGEREIEVGIVELLEALRRVLREESPVSAVHSLVGEPITVQERMIAVMEALSGTEYVELDVVLRGADGAAPTRALIVATFLAILELTRLAAIRIFQSADERGVPQGGIRLRRGDAADHAWREALGEIEE